jgi:hypothetical protein
VITALPAATPFTTPVSKPTVATPEVDVLHAPPATVLASIVAPPAQTCGVPVIGEGSWLTVTTAPLTQPSIEVYWIEAVPALTPYTTPAASIVAILVDVLFHVPPVVALLSVVFWPVQTCAAPVITAGNAFTVTIVDVLQPVTSVYVIGVMPAPTPVTLPDEAVTVATEGTPLLHTPPVVVLVRFIV